MSSSSSSSNEEETILADIAHASCVSLTSKKRDNGLMHDPGSNLEKISKKRTSSQTVSMDWTAPVIEQLKCGLKSGTIVRSSLITMTDSHSDVNYICACNRENGIINENNNFAELQISQEFRDHVAKNLINILDREITLVKCEKTKKSHRHDKGIYLFSSSTVKSIDDQVATVSSKPSKRPRTVSSSSDESKAAAIADIASCIAYKPPSLNSSGKKKKKHV